MENRITVISEICGWSATIIFSALLLWYIYRFFSKTQTENHVTHRKASIKKVLLTVALAFLVSRFLLYAGGVLGAWRNGDIVSYIKHPAAYWTRWDAAHYVKLIENWYVNEGDPRYHIVFFPLYPALGRCLLFLTGISAEAAAYAVSNISFLGCGVIMYRLAETLLGNKGGARAVWLMMLSPLTLFCSIPYTESVFLLTTIGAVYAARKRRFFLAVLLGALSANSRMCGMATAIPIYYEMLRAADGQSFIKKYALSAVKVLPVALGLLAYIWLNYAVTGDPFKFMEYQSEHWSQNFGSLYNTVKYSLTNAFTYGLFSYRIGVWIPQVTAIFMSLALFALAAKRTYPGDMGYSMIYYYVSISPTWLLSGPRYLTAMYSVYVILADIARRKAVFFSLAAVFGGLCLLAGAMYAVNGYIL